MKYNAGIVAINTAIIMTTLFNGFEDWLRKESEKARLNARSNDYTVRKQGNYMFEKFEHTLSVLEHYKKYVLKVPGNDDQADEKS